MTPGSSDIPLADDLPEGWAYTEFSPFIVSMANGVYKPTEDYTSGADGVQCLRMYNIQSGGIVFDNVKRMILSPDEVEQYRLLPGDILVNRVNSRELVGKSAICEKFAERTVFESKNIRLRLDEQMIDPRYVNFLLLTPIARDRLSGDAKQTVGMATVSQPQLRSLMFPIAPLAEQKRIVAKVEKLLGRLREVRDRLACVPVILKRFRQSVLAAACSGRLTSDWRGNRPSGEKPNSSGHREVADDLPGIPAGWRWLAIRDVADVRGGIQKQPSRQPRRNAYPFLRVANVLRGRLDLSEMHKVELFEGELVKCRLQRGDLLIVEGNGSLSEVGRSAIWTGEIADCVHQNHIIRVRARDCSPHYLNMCWNSPAGCGRVSDVAVTTSGLYSLSTRKVAEMPVPIPPLAEQQEIVRRVERLFKLADAIEQRVTAATKRADKITQAILAKAFRGELVPTEAELARQEGRTYEPASALLARIQAERSAAPAKPARGCKANLVPAGRRTRGGRSRP